MTAVPALVYDTESDAMLDVATIDAALGYPLPGATTWAAPVTRWDGKWWIVCPSYNGHNIPGLIGACDPDANAWPEVP